MKNKIAMIVACAIVIIFAVITLLSVFAIKSIGTSDSDQILRLICESGEKNLDSYFTDVEHSVEIVSAFVEKDLEELPSDQLGAHIERAKDIFARMAEMTKGVLTYYYRIDPEVSTEEKGFWYVNLDQKGFVEHEVTDITGYDTSDTSGLVWFTVPKYENASKWLPPYSTENLDVYVISYNVPIHWGERFIGVIGIEIDYNTIAALVNDISQYKSSYAFLLNDESIIYHPDKVVTEKDSLIQAPDEMISDEQIVSYTFEGVEKRAAWLPLSNGMRLYVTVPVSDINANWSKWIRQTIAVSAVSLITIAFMFYYLIRVLRKQKAAEDLNANLEKELQSASEITELMGSMSLLFTNMPAMTFSKDAETGVFLACNKSFAVYAGKTDPKEIVGFTDFDLFDKEAAKRFVENDKITLSMDEAYVYFEDVWDAGNSSMRSVQTTKTKYRDAAGKLCILGMCVDVTKTTQAKAEEAAAQARQQKEKEKQAIVAHYKEDVERLSYQAYHDELTGVYNRAGYDLIFSGIDVGSIYLLMVDADGFKSINDGYGHEIGDRIIIKIANALRSNFRADDCICRIGGDEFVVMMLNAENNCREMIASKIEQINIDLENTSDGLPAISVSVGIAHGSEVSDPSELLELADKAMYETKHNGKHGYRFSADMK